jgi:histidine triad (HIT) family protein
MVYSDNMEIHQSIQDQQEEGSAKCLFCEIAAGRMQAKKIYEDTGYVAFLDINPRNPGHALVIPRKHYTTIFEMQDVDAGKYFEITKKVAAGIMKATKCNGVSISQSNGRAAGQIVGHVHFHVIPRFMNEGPVGLEGILQVKKLPDDVMDKIVQSIKISMAGGSAQGSTEQQKTRNRDEDEFFRI